jgi:hypothetical protein
VEQGKHDELMSKEGSAYAALVRLHLSATWHVDHDYKPIDSWVQLINTGSIVNYVGSSRNKSLYHDVTWYP